MKNKNHRCWMLVDDNEDVLNLLREMAGRSGIAVECFHSAEVALAAFAAAPEKFDLVITDFEMPGMNGVELCHQLRALAPGVKILLATGSSVVSEKSAAREGFSGLLHKPFPFAELRRAVDAIGAEEISGGDLN